MTSATVETTAQRTAMETDEQQYLTFMLGEELYGVDILKVQEIKGYTEVTRIPNTPPYIKGVLNLRGTIVPIVNLRTKFGMEEVEITAFTVIVVVVVKSRVMGIIVDSVSDVITLAGKDIQPSPEFGTKVDTSFIMGIGTAGERLVTLLDIDRVLTDEEMAHMEAMA
ncbi:MAG: chemotaxis protein CheW, partial [Nitrospirae bacterium]